MNAPRVSLTSWEQTTSFAPLAALGFFVRQQDLAAPFRARLHFAQPVHTASPELALLDLFVSILAGCRSVGQINVKIRPDRVLARAWGRSCFYEQSTIARVLDGCPVSQVQQLRAGTEALYRWLGQAPHHAWAHQALIVDIDLTGLPAGPQAVGSTRGYFSGKRGRAADNYVGSGLRNITKASPPCSIRATRPARRS
jgi:hypothetical protein